MAEKKEALRSGDEAVMKQVGEGKDILSRLRTCLSSLREHQTVLIFDPVRGNMGAPEDENLSEEEIVAQIS